MWTESGTRDVGEDLVHPHRIHDDIGSDSHSLLKVEIT
jgi:hypothetical protein